MFFLKAICDAIDWWCSTDFCKAEFSRHLIVSLYAYLSIKVQRQLQLRIEAQGKYLKKIIEEQQKLSGVLSGAPVASSFSAPASGDNCPETDKNDPPTPAPTSESPRQEKPLKEHAQAKSVSIDDCFSSDHEPLTPDSGCHSSPSESPRPVKKQRQYRDGAFAKSEMILAHQILESSLNSTHKESCSVFPAREKFNPSSGISIGEDDRLDWTWTTRFS